MRAIAVMAFSFVALTAPAGSQTLEQQERQNLFEKFLTEADHLRAVVDKMSNEKRRQCLTAVANVVFCECLKENLPVVINFIQYVSIVTHTKEELEYDKLSPEDKQAVDNTRHVRDKCIRRGP